MMKEYNEIQFLKTTTRKDLNLTILSPRGSYKSLRYLGPIRDMLADLSSQVFITK